MIAKLSYFFRSLLPATLKMGKWENKYNNNRQYNKKWEKQFNWLTWQNSCCVCEICNCVITNLRISAFNAHEQSIKHRMNMVKFLNSNNLRGNLESNDTESYGSSGEINQSLTQAQNQSPLNKCLSPPKRLMIKSPGIERTTLEDAIGNFYKTLGSSSEERVSSSNCEDSDEAFGRYLGKELKNIKNIHIKKKLKLKIMNMVLNTEDSTEGNNSLRPYPIFVSTSANIEFPKCSDEA